MNPNIDKAKTMSLAFCNTHICQDSGRGRRLRNSME